jgi:hypothetical protein
MDELEALREEVKRLRAGLAAVESLILDSDGVYGLHLNGDPSPWGELRSGGKFEDWLYEFDRAIESPEVA